MKKDPAIHILYMEDDLDQIRLFLKALEYESYWEDYTVDHAENGNDGLALYDKKSYDVIIIDYRMSGLTGLEVLKALVSRKNHPPVIMLTGDETEKTASQARKLGVSDCLTRDFAGMYLKLLPKLIQRIIKEHKLGTGPRENIFIGS